MTEETVERTAWFDGSYFLKMARTSLHTSKKISECQMTDSNLEKASLQHKVAIFLRLNKTFI